MFRYLSKLPYDDPFKDYPHYVALVLLPAGRQQKREANVFHGTKLAEKWVSVILEELTPEQRRGFPGEDPEICQSRPGCAVRAGVGRQAGKRLSGMGSRAIVRQPVRTGLRSRRADGDDATHGNEEVLVGPRHRPVGRPAAGLRKALIGHVNGNRSSGRMSARAMQRKMPAAAASASPTRVW